MFGGDIDECEPSEVFVREALVRIEYNVPGDGRELQWDAWRTNAVFPLV